MKSLPVLPSAPEPPLSGFAPTPPWPHVPTVEWQVCGQCNYDCSYCIQARKHRVGYPTADELGRALAFLRTLPGTWEIKMTGGEPFASPLFLSTIVPALAEMPHRISLLTNLSAPVRHLEAFAARTYGRVEIVSASLHLEFTTVATFVARLRALRSALAPEARVVVNSVLVPDRLAEVAEAKRHVEAEGFRFFPQLMKVKHGVYAYSAAEMHEVSAIVGDLDTAARLRSANLAPSYEGRTCYTGARYFVLLQNGEGWSCRSARRHGQGYLGSVADGSLRLREGPVRCAYFLCPCAVPANRGMIEGVPARLMDAPAGDTDP